jgi:microcystin-dependent protein
MIKVVGYLQALSLLVVVLGPIPVIAQNTGNTGGGQTFDNRQPTLAVNYMICMSGLFPENNGTGLGEVYLTQPFLGEIFPVASGVIPEGFEACNGQVLTISQDMPMFSLLGTLYGGNGTTTFQLPDLQGQTLIGAGQGSGLPDYVLGGDYGIEQETLATTNLPAHTHTTADGNTGSTGSGASFNNLQPSVAISFCICTNGQIMMFAGDFAPDGWVLCNGSLYTIASQPVLYSFLGTNYGGDGKTNFAVPDLRGRAPLGYGQGSGLSAYTLGESSGASSQTLSISQMPSHTHSLPAGETSGSTGGNSSFDTRQPTLAMGWYICTSGFIPSSGSGAEFPMLGELRLLASTMSVPSGFVQANGATESPSEETSLFSLLGTDYGGNGTTTFNLPDLRSRLAVHEGQGTGTSSYSLGTTAGAESTILSISQMPSHSHELPGIIAVASPPGTPLTNNVSTVGFGSIALGAGAVTNTFEIENNGGLSLALTNPIVTGNDAADFTLSPPGSTIDGSGNELFTITFQPTGAGARAASLYLTNSDLANDPFVINLTGTGTVSAPTLTGALLTNGAVQFSFANSPYATFTVLTATNLSLPSSNWTVLGAPTNTGGNTFQFSVPVATNQPAQYYQVRSP